MDRRTFLTRAGAIALAMSIPNAPLTAVADTGPDILATLDTCIDYCDSPAAIYIDKDSWAKVLAADKGSITYEDVTLKVDAVDVVHTMPHYNDLPVTVVDLKGQNTAPVMFIQSDDNEYTRSLVPGYEHIGHHPRAHVWFENFEPMVKYR